MESSPYHQDRSIAFRVEALDQTHGVVCMYWGFRSFFQTLIESHFHDHFRIIGIITLRHWMEILVGLNWKLRPVFTRWAVSYAPEQWPSALDYLHHAKIFGCWLATNWTEFFTSNEPKWWNLLIAISQNSLALRVSSTIHFLNEFLSILILQYLQKDFRNGSETPTSNQQPFISTFNAILLHFPKLSLQFLLIWRDWTMENVMWRREYSRHHDQNLFLPFHGTRAFSTWITFSPVCSWSLFELYSNRDGFSRRRKRRRLSI